jgi:hypothetical protein
MATKDERSDKRAGMRKVRDERKAARQAAVEPTEQQ